MNPRIRTEKVCIRCGQAFEAVGTYEKFHRNHCGIKCSTKTSAETRYANAEERFASNYVKTESGCWAWTAAKNDDGYGHMRFRGRGRAAHRLSFELHRGPIPDGLCVLHKCDNPSCVNPDHLFLGTHSDNMQDMARKGRQRSPFNVSGERHPASKLRASEVLEIRHAHAQGISAQELSSKYGVSAAQIHLIARRKTWQHL